MSNLDTARVRAEKEKEKFRAGRERDSKEELQRYQAAARKESVEAEIIYLSRGLLLDRERLDGLVDEYYVQLRLEMDKIQDRLYRCINGLLDESSDDLILLEALVEAMTHKNQRSEFSFINESNGKF